MCFLEVWNYILGYYINAYSRQQGISGLEMAIQVAQEAANTNPKDYPDRKAI